jgi:hypothetical protein
VCFLTPAPGGSKITKVAIAPQRRGRSFSPFGHLIRYVFARVSRPPRPAASAFSSSGDVDTFGRKLGIAIQRGVFVF